MQHHPRGICSESNCTPPLCASCSVFFSNMQTLEVMLSTIAAAWCMVHCALYMVHGACSTHTPQRHFYETAKMAAYLLQLYSL